jgi:hypothetical protein
MKIQPNTTLMNSLSEDENSHIILEQQTALGFIDEVVLEQEAVEKLVAEILKTTNCKLQLNYYLSIIMETLAHDLSKV